MPVCVDGIATVADSTEVDDYRTNAVTREWKECRRCIRIPGAADTFMRDPKLPSGHRGGLHHRARFAGLLNDQDVVSQDV